MRLYIAMLVLPVAVIGCATQNTAVKPDAHVDPKLANFVRAVPDMPERVQFLTRENAVSMRSGYVALKPGENCGWHSTGDYEELVVCLSGNGHVEADGAESHPLAAEQVAYNPPHSRHCVFNDGTVLMRYVYVVAPAQAPAEKAEPMHHDHAHPD